MFLGPWLMASQHLFPAATWQLPSRFITRPGTANGHPTTYHVAQRRKYGFGEG
jgi:hypothetical protein